MRALFLSILVLGTGLVLAETEFSKSSDTLVEAWAQADTPDKRKAAMTVSYEALKRQVRARNPEDISALVRVLGAIYAWDYDPQNDTLAMFRKRLDEPEFRHAFEEELARLPDAQRASLGNGVQNLQTRADCQYKKKAYVCKKPE